MRHDTWHVTDTNREQKSSAYDTINAYIGRGDYVEK
jgi:hypothetical protein